MPMVLVIEDDEALRRLLIDVLSDEDLTVIAAANASEARDRWEQKPDLVLLDLLLQGMVADSLVAQLPLPLRSTPIIVTSAWELDRLREAARAMGAVGILRKPFDLDELVLVVRRALAGELAEADGSHRS